MANTYTLINSTSLSTTAASVTFSAIPATYDDLALCFSTRDDNAVVDSYVNLRINSDNSSLYSYTRLVGNGSSAASQNQTSLTWAYTASNGASATSNTFGIGEFYIPNYRVSQNRQISGFSVGETNATAAQIYAIAWLYRSTTAITSLQIIPYFGTGNFVSGSTFWLYGIKNS